MGGDVQTLSNEDLEIVEDTVPMTQLDTLRKQLQQKEMMIADMKQQISCQKSQMDDLTEKLVEALVRSHSWLSTLASLLFGPGQSEKLMQIHVQDKVKMKKLTEELQEKVTEVEQAAIAVFQYQSEVKKLQGQVQQLSQTMRTNDEASNKMRATLMQELRELRGIDSRNTFSVADSDIEARWTQLSFLVRNFVRQYVKVPFTCPKGYGNQFDGLVPYPETALQIPLICPFVVESRIWNWIENHIFSDSSPFWAGALGQSFARTLRGLLDAVKDNPEMLNQYHDLRSRSAILLYRSAAGQRASPQDVAESFLRQVFGTDLGASTPSTSSMLPDATEIFKVAMELDMDFRRSKANFFIVGAQLHVKDARFAFQKQYFEQKCQLGPEDDDLEISKKLVDVVVTPGLLKYGKNNGGSYDTHSVIAKAKVLCGVSDFMESCYRNSDTSTGRDRSGESTSSPNQHTDSIRANTEEPTL